jgi:hypothetical protein
MFCMFKRRLVKFTSTPKLSTNIGAHQYNSSRIDFSKAWSCLLFSHLWLRNADEFSLCHALSCWALQIVNEMEAQAICASDGHACSFSSGCALRYERVGTKGAPYGGAKVVVVSSTSLQHKQSQLLFNRNSSAAEWFTALRFEKSSSCAHMASTPDEICACQSLWLSVGGKKKTHNTQTHNTSLSLSVLTSELPKELRVAHQN